MLLAAETRGDLGELEQQTRLGLACLHRLAAEPDALPAETLRAAATVFRYEHNLLAAEELEAWLDARGLSVSDWNGYLRHLVLRERWAGELDRIVSEYSVDDDVVEAALTAEAICSGFLRTAAERLAEDVTLAAAGHDGSDPSLPEVEREIAAHGLDWIRIEAETLELADAEATREAALCVRVDGRTLGDVAEDCGQPASAVELYLADAEPELQAKLVSASPGELIGPLDRGAGHVLLQLVAKTEPSASDPEVRRRAASALTARAVERELRDRVRWHDRP